ncbi:3-oxosteroid 1-dehydrogenase [Streptomyces viridiviolaceus]|uniref:FAD-dependent oxidoreductase n=1 Tax=Streptomyces viridiviolaceus TaxID=68282 RepID=A0ABW2E5G2_9ACTN|nr:FAD-dependent oxidoreductase [Streptomyces viridiviolaceus]GHB70736.1 3-oxosteroid 1-dehydrogenase [Streptomyces viridiviolaceus]
MANTDQTWDQECDVLVVGSGGGALTGAYGTAARGLDTLVIEKTGHFGGTTAYAGACLWLPGNQAQERDGVPDSADLGRTYFRAVVGDATPHELQDAYIDGASATVTFLEDNPHVRFEHRPFPDYYAAPGRFEAGRGVFPVELPAPGGPHPLLDAVRPPAWADRLGLPAPDGPLTDGRALIGRLLLALESTGNGRTLLHTALTGLITEAGRVVGAEAAHDGGTLRIRARRGVLLAAGGFEANAELRREWQDLPGADWTMGAPGGNTGDALIAAARAGAATGLLDQAWWCPSLRFPDGSAAFTLGLRGGIFVDGSGRRFANESLPYDRMGRRMLAAKAGTTPDNPVWWVFDDRFGGELPGITVVPADRHAFTAAGLWRTAETLDGLARQIGVDAEALGSTVRTFNGYAAEGVDADFHRGEDPYDRFFVADAATRAPGAADANPCLVPIESGPFHAVQIVLGDLGTKGGVRTDTRARVLREDGLPIPGLYAAGNTAASVSGPHYPGPGAPIGSAMVFGHIAAADMAGQEADR